MTTRGVCIHCGERVELNSGWAWTHCLTGWANCTAPRRDGTRYGLGDVLALMLAGGLPMLATTAQTAIQEPTDA